MNDFNGRSVHIDERMPIDKALRKLKRKVADSGVVQKVKDEQHYIKPTTRRQAKKKAAIKRWKKKLEQSQPKKQ